MGRRFCGDGGFGKPRLEEGALKSSVVVSSWHPWHPGWAVSWRCSAAWAPQSPAPSWDPRQSGAAAAPQSPGSSADQQHTIRNRQTMEKEWVVFSVLLRIILQELFCFWYFFLPLRHWCLIPLGHNPLIKAVPSMLMVDVTHKVKVSILRHLPIVREDILGLDVVAGLLLRLVMVVILLLLGCLVGVLLVKIVHEGWTYWLLGGGVPCGGKGGLCFNTWIVSLVNTPVNTTAIPSPLYDNLTDH